MPASHFSKTSFWENCKIGLILNTGVDTDYFNIGITIFGAIICVCPNLVIGIYYQ